jgi:hypothetical protein
VIAPAALPAIFLLGGGTDRLFHQDQLVFRNRQFPKIERLEDLIPSPEQEGFCSFPFPVASGDAVSRGDNPADDYAARYLCRLERIFYFGSYKRAVLNGAKILTWEKSKARKNVSGLRTPVRFTPRV